jgi:osmotically-inducible protein OsmY
MKNNEELQNDVQNAIKWEPLLNAAEIGVTVKDGIVSLTGVVDCYAKKLEAENAAKSIAGVKAVVEKIEIKFNNASNKSDEDIANEALRALKGRWDIPSDKIQVKVEDGWITLNGELPWNYQKEAAKQAVHYLNGVKGISNSITVKSETNEEIEILNVENALARNWPVNSQNIKVSASGTKVILNGIVTSWYLKDEAGRIAWNTPGVWAVDNELAVDYDYSLAN